MSRATFRFACLLLALGSAYGVKHSTKLIKDRLFSLHGAIIWRISLNIVRLTNCHPQFTATHLPLPHLPTQFFGLKGNISATFSCGGSHLLFIMWVQPKKAFFRFNNFMLWITCCRPEAQARQSHISGSISSVIVIDKRRRIDERWWERARVFGQTEERVNTDLTNFLDFCNFLCYPGW